MAELGLRDVLREGPKAVMWCEGRDGFSAVMLEVRSLLLGC